MSVSENPERDTALAMLAYACDQLGLPDRPSVQANGQPMPPPNVETLESDAEPLPANSRPVPWRPWLWGIKVAATIGLALLSVAAIVWVSIHARPIPSPNANSTMDVSAKPASPENTAAAINTGRSQPSQHAPGEAVPASPPIVSKDADRQSIQEQTRALLDVRQEIGQLKSSQNQMTRENSELAQRLKAALETAQSNADRIEELKASLTELVRGKDSLTEQLSASQEQMTGALAQLKSSQEQLANVAAQLKSTQEQVARLTEQKSRPRTIATVAQPVVNRTQRPPPPAPSQLKLPLRANPGQSPH
jgi:HAMP domain-containing protein